MTSTSRQGTAEDADGQNYTLPYPTQPICILPNLLSHYLPYPALISSILICSTFHPNDTLHYLLLPIPTPHYIILLYHTSAYLPTLPYFVLHHAPYHTTIPIHAHWRQSWGCNLQIVDSGIVGRLQGSYGNRGRGVK